jgi:cytoskeletal protein CcmA (bactofilin family)
VPVLTIPKSYLADIPHREFTLNVLNSEQVSRMFRRKPEDDQANALPAPNDDLGIPKPVARPAAPTPAGAVKPTAATPLRPASAETPRPADLPRVPRMPTEATPASRKNETEIRKLIVGREISLTGEITQCDRLVVEGSIEANLVGCRDVDIADSGLFKGSASIDEADIRGRFEGVLTVRKRLFIRSTGKVIGTIRYGQLEIECGGQISGDVQSQPINEAGEQPTSRMLEAKTA